MSIALDILTCIVYTKYTLYTMHTKTQQNIAKFIQNHPGSSTKEIIQQLALYPTGVFRHLRVLQKNGQIYKVGKPPAVRYYTYATNMHRESSILTDALNWAVSGNPKFASADVLCPTRDVFQARTDRLVTTLKKSVGNENLAYLLVAAVGEIGNNSFDHNLGHWQDIPGVHFQHDEKEREIVLADRGQGIYATIKRVKPSVRDESDAVLVAFTEMISGRAPEKRGNGLKFVKKVIEENNLFLELYTGSVKAQIDGSKFDIVQGNMSIPGTVAFITF